MSEEVIGKVVSVFARYPEVSSVILFGSRAKGNYRPALDIDLTAKGDSLSHDLLLNLELALDDLLLPYKIDLSLYSQVDNADLLDHIDRVGIPVYKRVT